VPASSKAEMAAQPADTRPVLVAGATGYLGGFVVRELLRRGVSVRALVRPSPSVAAAAEELAAAGADVVPRDATRPGALLG
jgi:dihydroflavonol-4-reductase